MNRLLLLFRSWYDNITIMIGAAGKLIPPILFAWVFLWFACSSPCSEGSIECIVCEDEVIAPPPNYEPNRELVESTAKLTAKFCGKATFTHRFDDGSPEWQIDLERANATANDAKLIIGGICGSTVREFSIRKTEISDEIVEVIGLCGPHYIKFNGVDHVMFGSGITKLDLSYSNVTAKGVNKMLRHLRLLGYLNISGLHLDSELFSGTEDSNLRALSMQRVFLEPSVALRISTLRLKSLDLKESAIGDDFISNLVSTSKRKNSLLSSLESVDISATRVTDRSIKQISLFSKLRKLRLSSSAISDRQQISDMISRLAFLEEIDLLNTSLSPTDITTLVKDWPKIRFVK